MRELLFICFLLMYFPLIGLSQRARNIEGKGYQGYIFSERNNAFVGIEDQVSKFTPDLATVKIFEDRHRESIGTLLHDISEPNAGCPNIQRQLKTRTARLLGSFTGGGALSVWPQHRAGCCGPKKNRPERNQTLS